MDQILSIVYLLVFSFSYISFSFSCVSCLMYSSLLFVILSSPFPPTGDKQELFVEKITVKDHDEISE